MICEGYESPEDPFVLKGSCGVEYRLVLTESGEERYGVVEEAKGFGGAKGEWFSRVVFWLFFACEFNGMNHCLSSMKAGLTLMYAVIVAVFVRGAWDTYQRRNQGRRPQPGPGTGGWGGGPDDGTHNHIYTALSHTAFDD